MTLNINDREVFVPTTNGNDKSDKPITFHLRFLTAGEQSEIEYMEYVSLSGKVNPRVKVRFNHRDYFRLGVERIENLDLKGEAIDTADKFLDIRGPKWMSDMVIEVALHLKNAMDVDSKN